MGESVLKGISAALGVTAVTLFAGLLWTAMNLGGLSTSTLVDLGLIASCVAAGYVTGKDSGQWILGGVSSIGYVLLCVLLVALFLELRAWGVVQVLAEGGLIGILAGALGAGSGGKKARSGWRTPRTPLWSDSYSSRGFSSGGAAWGGYSNDYKDDYWNDYRDDHTDTYQNDYRSGYKDAYRDDHMNDWDDLLNEERENFCDSQWEEQQWNRSSKPVRSKKVWWEEDVL